MISLPLNDLIAKSKSDRAVTPEMIEAVSWLGTRRAGRERV